MTRPKHWPVLGIATGAMAAQLWQSHRRRLAPARRVDKVMPRAVFNLGVAAES